MEKKKVKKNNNNDDLKFTPLDINSPLNMGNSKLNSITTPNALDGISINSDCNNIYIGFPPLGLNSSTNMNTPYMNTENIADTNMSSTNIGNPYMTNSSLLNPTFNSGNTTGYYPECLILIIFLQWIPVILLLLIHLMRMP